MSDLQSRRQSVEAWLTVADEDLWMIEAALSHDPPFVHPALFHAQQAGEKYLKAFLVWNGARFPKTHDLKLLLELCLPFDPELSILREACFALSELGVEPRYPMSGPPIAIEQAHQAQTDALSIRNAIKSRFAWL